MSSILPLCVFLPLLTEEGFECAGEKPLYHVLEQRAAAVGDNLMGSDHTYVIPGASGAPKGAAAAAAKKYATLRCKGLLGMLCSSC